MHPSRSCGAISRFILAGVEIGYPDAVEIHRRRAKRQDILNTLGQKIRRDIGHRGCLRDNVVLLFGYEFFNESRICFSPEDKMGCEFYYIFMTIFLNIGL